MRNPASRIFLLAAIGLLSAASFSRDAETAAEVGAATCAGCHEKQAASLKSTAHGARLEKVKGVPFEKSCETCHGAGGAHAAGGDAAAIFNPGKAAGEKASETCLTCHSSDRNRMFWEGSAHAGKGNSCVSCHKVHGGNDLLLKKAAEKDVCFSCHPDVKADIAKRSKHPLRDFASKTGAGKMTCSSCHNAHGSRGEKLIAAKSINDKCYECHAEKQAPLLWEHAPVKEDCMTCHSAHGSSNNKLLTMKVPRLCQSCHIQGRHQSGTLAANSAYAVGRSCLNCHMMIHGSNHPSGTVLQR
ncbi:MAG: DmsE family decaheme c-type cytochrome [Elusimicrobia bacterium]|nr:DmsE family decaheme c-type cytochrome [Elusimicrobiota bacterium]